MSWKYATTMSEVEDPENRCRKSCCCVGHNASNPKKNKHYHSTKQKLDIKKARKEKELFLNTLTTEE